MPLSHMDTCSFGLLTAVIRVLGLVVRLVEAGHDPSRVIGLLGVLLLAGK